MSICILFYKMIKLASKEKKKYRYIKKEWEREVPYEGLNPSQANPEEAGAGPGAGAAGLSPLCCGLGTLQGYRGDLEPRSPCTPSSQGTSCLSRVEFLNRDFRI